MHRSVNYFEHVQHMYGIFVLLQSTFFVYVAFLFVTIGNAMQEVLYKSCKDHDGAHTMNNPGPRASNRSFSTRSRSESAHIEPRSSGFLEISSSSA